MTVKSNRINTSVSFAFANIAENSLEVRQGDLLSFTADWFVTKATPESVIIWIANDKFSFPENNQTQEQWRVDYNPVIWENTYKMEVTGDISQVKVGHFYTMDENQKLDVSTDSPSVWQFMVQDVYANSVDVRFVTNLWLAIDQYEDVRLVSVAPKNPDVTPFDWIYVFTLSNWTIIEWDFSDLCRWTTDITFWGNVAIAWELQVAWNSILWDIVVNDIVAGNIQANEIMANITTETANIAEANITDLNVENMNYTNPVHLEHDVDVDEDVNIDWNLHVWVNATVDHQLTVNEQLNLWPNWRAPQFVLQSEKNQPNGVAGLDANGKLSDSVLPPLAIHETFVCADETEQLGLTAERGDICIRTDLNKTFIKLNDTNPATMADWQEIYAEQPQKWYWEEYTEDGSAEYTLTKHPVTATSFMVFTDSGTALFPTVDYTYDNSTDTISFLSLNNWETVHIWILSYE